MVLDANTPKPYAYLVSHLSKALIKQAESEVSAKAEAAFPLARVVLGLILRGHAALSDILFARFVKKCPWVVPFYPSKQQVSSTTRRMQRS
jgi:nucleoporin GLE1